jgi:hypothetical protein
MNNTKKIIIHGGTILALGYLWSADFYPAQFILAIYVLALFFEARISAYCFLFFVFLLPFLVYNNEIRIAEHYAVSAYIFLCGTVAYALARQNRIFEDFFTLDYSQIMHIITGEKIFKNNLFSEKFQKMATYFIPLAIFAFLLLSPMADFLLINKK